MAQKILVIDDSQTASEIAQNVFARHFPGCDVLVAPRDSDAFERLNAANPDLILLNDGLPEINAVARGHEDVTAGEMTRKNILGDF